MAATGRAPFAQRLLRWFDHHGRHDLPWQQPRTAYRVWLAEVMLQQTQVATVIPYYRRFLRRFPSIGALARAPMDDVLALWSGLGYYARGRNLHRAAQRIVGQHHGKFPQQLDEVLALPGIGRSTAGAILAQAHGQRHPILDGNVKRVLARHFGIRGWPGEPAVAARLWTVAEQVLPDQRLADYTQALMDLGATLCTPRQPACPGCPLNTDCSAWVEGSVSAIPTPRPRKARPRRKAHALLLENVEGAWLLEKRPAEGIWGGLWSTPIVNGDWRKACEQHYGIAPERARKLPAVKHAFTHFDLTIVPVRIKASAPLRTENGQEVAWVTLPQLRNYGLPAPVRRLLLAQAPTNVPHRPLHQARR